MTRHLTPASVPQIKTVLLLCENHQSVKIFEVKNDTLSYSFSEMDSAVIVLGFESV